MTQTLFRAIIPHAGTVTGADPLRSPRWSLLTAFLGLSIAAAIAFAATADYARKQTTAGALVPDTETVRITTPRAGILTEPFVANGATVAPGDPLFTVDYRQSLEGGGTLDAGVRTALEHQAVLLKEQLAAEELRTQTERGRLEAKIAGQSDELDALSSQRQLADTRVRVAHDRAAVGNDLYRRGLITENDFRAREDAALARQQELAALDQRIANVKQNVREARLELEQLPADIADRVAKLRAGLDDLEQRKAEAAAQGSQIVRAPIAGRVTSLQGTAGMRVEIAKPVLALLPPSSSLRAELFVPSRAIGFVRPGQRVRLMYDAFPFQRFGTYGGKVEGVSETVLAPDEVIGPVHPRDPSYRIIVRLDQPTVAAFGHEVALQPDMTVQADIVLEPRTLLEWLLEPLYSISGRI
jgi:membrane fusion protein